VGGVIVHHQMHISAARDIALDLAQEAQELASAMTAPNDRAGGGAERREQAEGRQSVSRYARQAEVRNSAAFSSAEAPAEIRLNAFHRTR
jgi:hypothetical protein